MGILLSRRAAVASTLMGLTTALSGCATAPDPKKLRLGYFANVTHGAPMVAMARGLFAHHLPGVSLEPQIFTSGPPAVAALLAGALDVAYLGPSPAVTAWVRTKGQGVKLIAGSASGGAALVARSNIRNVRDLIGKTVATPGQGGTQDVALRYLLRSHGIKVGGGSDEVNVVWMASSQSLDQFKQGRLDAVYQAEPWVSRFVVEGGAHVVVDEATLWPRASFATTVVLATQDFLTRAEPQVRGMLAGQLDAESWIKANPQAAKTLMNNELRRLTGKKLKPQVMERAKGHVQFTHEPLMTNIAQVAKHTWDVGAINVRPDIRGMADLRPLNTVLQARGSQKVSADGYGKE